jgi:prepilin-type N-terminal cleavage/methylation domain-containing protein
MKRYGFTLIELLIVVAIIAILAAIAVPNFLEAQVRSKVSRTKADLRTIATALESYAVDYNKYPLDTYEKIQAGLPSVWGTEDVYVALTTPVSYVTSVELARDVFQQNRSIAGWTGWYTYKNYWNPSGLSPAGSVIAGNGQSYSHEGVTMGWLLYSFGPDGDSEAYPAGTPIDYYPVTQSYDATNGTTSSGDIPRWGP